MELLSTLQRRRTLHQLSISFQTTEGRSCQGFHSLIIIPCSFSLPSNSTVSSPLPILIHPHPIHRPFHHRWSDGIPPAMGGHLMVSGDLAPLSQSKGPGINIHPQYFSYPSDDSLNVDVTIYENDSDAAAGLSNLIADASKAAISQHASFTIALSGGSLLRTLQSALLDRKDIDYSKWTVVFADERHVSHSSPDSTYGVAHESLLRKLPIPASHILAIGQGNMSVEQAATHYAGQMLELSHDVLPRTSEGLPIIDLVLLGVGPDGHVASLFPNRPETAVAASSSPWVLPVKASPKPPAERITLSMPVLNAAKHVSVVALGQGKAEVVQRALEVQTLPGALPVQMVRPEKLTWVLDKPAAENLIVNEWTETKKFPRST